MTAIHQSPAVLLTCSCGMLPLDDALHASARQAWETAAEHVKLNPARCAPNMTRTMVPAALAPTADPRPRMQSMFEVV